MLFRITAHLPPRLRWRALLGSDEPLTDLYPDVDPERDHIRGAVDAPVTVVEYGDFECPYCGRAEPVLRELLRDFTNVRYVWRHLPLTDVHVHAQLAAEAAEAASDQGAFWEMHDLLFANQKHLQDEDLHSYAARLGLDLERFDREIAQRVHAERVHEDFMSGVRSGVNGTPTFYIDGMRHDDSYETDVLLDALERAASRT